MANEEVLTAAQAGVLLQKSTRAVRDLLRAGRLPGRKVGKDWRLSRAAIEDFLRASPVPAPMVTREEP